MKYTLLLWLLSISFAFAQTDTTAVSEQEATNVNASEAAAAEENSEQASAPTQAPSQDLFNVDRDQVGMFQNSVNLFTGEVAFSLPLVSLPGRGGLNAGVALSYNAAGVPEQTKRWNLSAPTGVAGLGWQLIIPHIVVDNKQTGTRIDDDFYLVEGGVSNPLILVKIDDNGVPEADIPESDGEVRVFQSTNYKFWDIYYVASQEKWVILQEDGSTLIYGDQDSERNTVEYVVRWGNWIGNSSLTDGQSQQAMRWNLSEGRDIFDNAITYTYQPALQYVGSDAGKQHTEAAYLSKITNPQGQTVTLVYEEKATEEYQDPHTEKVEPDAYQERYERLALDKIEVRDESEALRYTLEMEYQFLGTGDFTKRLLTSVQKTGENDTQLPPLLFDYERAGQTVGMLKTVTTAQGGTVSYTREAVTIENAERMLTILANDPPAEPEEPEGPDPIEPEEPKPVEPGTPTTSRPVYAEPQTWIGPDYVVVAWRALRNSGHTGEGRSVKLAVYQWNGRWIETIRQTISNVGLQNGYYRDFEVTLQADFFAVKHDNDLYLSHKDPQQPGKWLNQNITFEKDGDPSRLVSGEDFVVVGGQFLAEGELSAWRWDGDAWDKETFNLPEGDYAYTAANNYFIAHDNDPNPDRISLFYLDEQAVWRQKNASTANRFTSGSGAGSGRSNWYGTNSFAMVLADDNEEFIYQWDEDYALKRKAGILGGWTDEYPAYLTGSNMIGLAEKQGKLKAFRYDGAAWTGSLKENLFHYESSFGQDFVISYNTNFVNFGASIRYYNANTRQWSEKPLRNNPNNVTLRVVSAGSNYAFYNGLSYYRNPAGTWNLIHTTPDGEIGDWTEDDFLLGGDNIVAVYSLSAKKTYVMKEENGEVTIIATLEGQSISQRGEAVKATPLVGSDIVVTFPALSDGSAVMQNMISLTLHKLIDGQLTGPQIAYPVKTVTVESGQSTQYVSYAYTAATATMSAGGGVAQFNQVRVVPGVSDPDTHPYGYTQQYFFNGLSSGRSSLPFPTIISQTTPAAYYGKLLGLPYASQTYDKNDALVAESTSYWKVYERDLSSFLGRDLAKAYLAQVVRSEQSRDGVSQRMDYDYGDDETTAGINSIFRNGQLRSMSTTDSEGRTRTTQYLYAFNNETYNSYGSALLREAHMLSYPVVQSVSVDGTVVQKSETYYQALSNDAGSVVPEKTIAYPRGESKSITVGYRYDDYGNMIESRRAGGLTTAMLWGYDYSRPVAQAVGVSYETLSGQVAPDGIQDLTGSALQGALAPLRTIAQAQVSTTAYDRLYGVTSETDPNGRSSYYEYDDLGRMYLTRNQENNITGKMEYGYYASTTVPEPEEPEPEPEPCTTSPSVSLSGSNRVSLGLTATFTAQATGCGSFTYQWGASKGTVVSTSGNRAVIRFSNCGPDDVTVTVKDANGRSGSASKSITVDDPTGNACDGTAPQAQPATPTPQDN